MCVGICMYGYFKWINIEACDESEPKCTKQFILDDLVRILNFFYITY